MDYLITDTDITIEQSTDLTGEETTEDSTETTDETEAEESEEELQEEEDSEEKEGEEEADEEELVDDEAVVAATEGEVDVAAKVAADGEAKNGKGLSSQLAKEKMTPEAERAEIIKIFDEVFDLLQCK